MLYLNVCNLIFKISKLSLNIEWYISLEGIYFLPKILHNIIKHVNPDIMYITSLRSCI